jgi:hypothetical protein
VLLLLLLQHLVAAIEVAWGLSRPACFVWCSLSCLLHHHLPPLPLLLVLLQLTP